MRYFFRRGVPAIYVEIYLPKKSGFQGPLYSALTKGRDPEFVRHHFSEHIDEIKEMVEKDWPELVSKIDEGLGKSLADSIEDIFVGYSMYEVDGVFFTKSTPFEERTQVVRLMFECPIPLHYREELLTEIKQFIAKPLRGKRYSYQPSEKEYKQQIDEVNEWIDKVGAFLFGFVLHRIELAIRENPELEQHEIWLTSFWSAEINKLVPKNP